MTLAVSTWNMKGRPGPVRDFVEKLGSFSNVLCHQEAHGRHDEIAAALPKWDIYGFDPVPIVVDPSALHVIAQGMFFETPETYVGPEGAGPSRLKEKWFSFVCVEDPKNDGKRTWVFNNHGAPSIKYEARDALNEKQVEVLAEFGGKVSRPDSLVICGDFNAEWQNPNLKPLHKLGMNLDTPKGVTHDQTHSRIDLVLSKGLRAERARIIQGVVSWDHNAVHVEYR